MQKQRYDVEGFFPFKHSAAFDLNTASFYAELVLIAMTNHWTNSTMLCLFPAECLVSHHHTIRSVCSIQRQVACACYDWSRNFGMDGCGSRARFVADLTSGILAEQTVHADKVALSLHDYIPQKDWEKHCLLRSSPIEAGFHRPIEWFAKLLRLHFSCHSLMHGE